MDAICLQGEIAEFYGSTKAGQRDKLEAMTMQNPHQNTPAVNNRHVYEFSCPEAEESYKLKNSVIAFGNVLRNVTSDKLLTYQSD